MRKRSVNFEKSEKVNFNGFCFLEKKRKKEYECQTTIKEKRRKKGKYVGRGGDEYKNENMYSFFSF